ncbi:MAG: phosphoribosyl-AMP cyclohydrolase [Spirochaetales bacterium]|nr:phosphoribosyl-AMP cyclohydrolase [Spirochaetales bacterium]
MKNEQLKPNFEKKNGLLPAVVQDASTKEVLMLGWINEEAWQKSLETRWATFWSTSRNELWVKGATSGDYLAIQEIRIDCDEDTLLFLVEPQGQGACHTKNQAGQTRRSCFFRSWDQGFWKNLDP